jgi:ABC-type antimicrobial peptide transport system permease subunit
MEVRTGGSPGTLAQALSAQLQPELGLPPEIRTMTSEVDKTLVQERMMAAVAGSLGALALTLAGVGLYGLLAYSVARRTREIGL